MNAESSFNASIQVQMFGGFAITIGDAAVREGDSHSRKAWLLLQYLIAFQKREVSPTELINILWPDTELANPSGSLKSLAFRARKLLSALPVPPSKLLIQQNGVYRWNPAFQTETDFEQLDALYLRIFTASGSEEEKISLCQKAVSLYQGEFLPNASGESWVIPVNTYYSSVFLKISHYYMDILMKRESFDGLIRLCRRVLSFDPYDETAHYYLTYALYLSGNQPAAVSHYQAVIDSFYNHPGELPALSGRFTSLYKIISSENHAQPADLDIILSQLSENTPPPGTLAEPISASMSFSGICAA